MKEAQILHFLESHNIEYITKGKNVKPGNVNIQCPFCGDDDKSHHMGIDLEKGYYGCWRASNHRGRDFAWVIQRLLNCTLKYAKSLISESLPLSAFDSLVENLWKDEPKKQKIIGGSDKLILDSSFRDISNQGSTLRFWYYLHNRGFKDVNRLLQKYQIKCCLSGRWRFRLIFPMYYKGDLITWQSRSIFENSSLPYMDLSINESVRHVKYCLYNYDGLLRGGEVLFLTEGIFDCLKLDYCFNNSKYRATCFFTKTMTDEQLYMVDDLSKVYDKVCILLDKDAEGQALITEDDLGFLKNIEVLQLEDGIKDPGELKCNEVKKLIGGL